MPTAGEYKHEPSGIPCHCFVRRRIRHAGRRKSCLRQPHLDRACKSKTVTFNPVLCVRSYDGDAKSDHERLCVQLAPPPPSAPHPRAQSPPPNTSTAGAKALCDKITAFLGFNGGAKHAHRSESRGLVSRPPVSCKHQEVNNEFVSPDVDARGSSPEPRPRYQLCDLTSSSISNDSSGFNGSNIPTENLLGPRSSHLSNFESSDLSSLPRYSRSSSHTAGSSCSSRNHSSIKQDTSQIDCNINLPSFMSNATSKRESTQKSNSSGSSTASFTNPEFPILDEGCPKRRNSASPPTSSHRYGTKEPSSNPASFGNRVISKSEPKYPNSFDSSTARSTNPSFTILDESRPPRRDSPTPHISSDVSHRDVGQAEQSCSNAPSYSYNVTGKSEPSQNPNRSHSSTASLTNPSFKISGDGRPTRRDFTQPDISNDTSYCNVRRTEPSNASFRAEGDEHETCTTTVRRHAKPTVVRSSGESSVKSDEDSYSRMHSHRDANCDYTTVGLAMRRRTESEHLDSWSTVPTFSDTHSMAPSMQKTEAGPFHSALQKLASRVPLSAPNLKTIVTRPYSIMFWNDSSKSDAQPGYGNTNFFTQPAGNASSNESSVTFTAGDVLRMTWIVLFWTGSAFLITLMYVFAFTCPKETE